MKNLVPTFEEYLFESGGPKELQKVAKQLKSKAYPHWDIKDTYYIDHPKLQIIYVEKDAGYGESGWQIGDENGNDLYTGTDSKKAIAAIKANEEEIFEGNTEWKVDDEFHNMPSKGGLRKGQISTKTIILAEITKDKKYIFRFPDRSKTKPLTKEEAMKRFKKK